MSAYRTSAEMPKEPTVMTEYERDALITKYIVGGIVAILVTVMAAVIAAVIADNHEGHVASVRIAEVAVAHARADADRAMFEAMNRVPK